MASSGVVTNVESAPMIANHGKDDRTTRTHYSRTHPSPVLGFWGKSTMPYAGIIAGVYRPLLVLEYSARNSEKHAAVSSLAWSR